MTKMLVIKRNMTIMVTITIVTLILTASPLIISIDEHQVFAHSCDEHEDHDHDNGNDSEKENPDEQNESEQSISQEQSSSQNSQVVSGEDTIASGNNVGLFFNSNLGNIALGQQ